MIFDTWNTFKWSKEETSYCIPSKDSFQSFCIQLLLLTLGIKQKFFLFELHNKKIHPIKLKEKLKEKLNRLSWAERAIAIQKLETTNHTNFWYLSTLWMAETTKGSLDVLSGNMGISWLWNCKSRFKFDFSLKNLTKYVYLSHFNENF